MIRIRAWDFCTQSANQGVSGSQLQKRLLKHFNLPARDIVTAGRQFPISSRIDLQNGLENLLNVDAATTLLGLVSPNSHESLTFAQMLGGPHAHVNVGPLQYDDIDIGDPVPTRALKNGLWMGRHNRQRFAILLAHFCPFCRSQLLVTDTPLAREGPPCRMIPFAIDHLARFTAIQTDSSSFCLDRNNFDSAQRISRRVGYATLRFRCAVAAACCQMETHEFHFSDA
jgi:hypothetical protein